MGAQALSLRAAPGDEADGLWSGPLEADLAGAAVRHLAIPYRRAPAPEPEAAFHGPRVQRTLQQLLGCVQR